MGNRCSFLHSDVFDSDERQCCRHCYNVRRLQIIQIFLLLAVVILTYVIFNIHAHCSCRGNSEDIEQLKLQFGVLERRLQSINADFGKSTPVGPQVTSKGKVDPSELVQKTLLDDRILRYRRSYRQRRSKRKKNKKNPHMVHVEGRGGLDLHTDISYERLSGTYSKWQYADWFTKLHDHEQKFKLNYSNGELTVQEGGIYLLYAQITMIGHIKHGFYVKRNGNIISTCNSSFGSNSNSSSTDVVSCSTVGIFHLRTRDKISIQHTSNQGTKALFDANSSFFGLYRLASIKKRKKRGDILI